MPPQLRPRWIIEGSKNRCRVTLKRVLYREEQIAARLDGLAVQITEDYRGKDLTVLAILNGSLIFMADLLRRIPLPSEVGLSCA